MQAWVDLPTARRGFSLLPRRWVVARLPLSHKLSPPRPRLRAAGRHAGEVMAIHPAEVGDPGGLPLTGPVLRGRSELVQRLGFEH